MKKIKYFAILSLFCLSIAQLRADDKTLVMASPNGEISVEVTLKEADGTLSYLVKNNATQIIANSKLGIITSTADLTSGLAYVSDNITSIDESYQLPTGKIKNYTNKCNELDIKLSKNSKDFHVIFRAFDDGIAYRYYIPGTGNLQIISELSEVNIPTFQTSWGQKYSHDYSVLYPARTWVETSEIENNKMSVPVLVKSTTGNDNWCLITESANYGNYCASDLMTGTTSQTGHFYFKLYESVNVELPLETSWKNIIIGDLPTIVHSVMTENLNPATEMQDLSWIKSGLSSWDWGGQDGGVTKDINVIKGYIDLAYKMKWSYYTLDDGWDDAPYRLKEVVDYANSKGVKLFIWSHQNRFQNNEDDIRSIMQNWKNLGFVGTKIDFFDNDSKDMMAKYDRLLKVSGEIGLMVNFHGCTKPSGTRRHWPHLITSEAVYGGEQYFFNHLATPAHHNVTLALTRNVIGPMDYTPTEFCRLDGIVRHLTTWSHQVALAVLYESGIQTMSDSHYNYVYNMSRTLLSQMPASWDEIRCLEANPDDYVTIARRSNNDWYIASISQNARTLNIPLDFLGSGNYTAQIYKDGTCPSDIAYEELSVSNASTLSVNIKATGGTTIRISQTPIEQPIHRVYEIENATLSSGATIENDNAGNCSGGKFVGFLGNGKTAKINNVIAEKAGKHNLTFYYISQDSRNTYVKVNNGEKKVYKFNGNGYSWNSDGLGTKTVQIELQAGDNTIELGNDNGDAVNIDRVEISLSDDYKDVKVSLASMPNSTNYTNSETIKAALTNESDEQLSNVSVSYKINQNTIATETIPVINAGSTLEYTFAQEADLSEYSVYNLEVVVNTDLANNIVGDMASTTFVHYPSLNETPINRKSNGGSIHSYSYQTNNNESAENLILGDDTKKWCDNNTRRPWVIMQLPEDYFVDRFVFRDCKTQESQFKNVDQYIISVSTKAPEENEWIEAINTADHKVADIKISNITPTKARYIKFETKIPDGDHAIRIYGFDVFGTKQATSNKDLSISNSNIFPSILKRGDILHINNKEKGFLAIYSIGGELVNSQNIVSNADIQLDLPVGMYFVKIISQGIENTEKIIVK